MLPILRAEDLVRARVHQRSPFRVPSDRKFVLMEIENYQHVNQGNVQGVDLNRFKSRAGWWVLEAGQTIALFNTGQTIHLHGFWVYNVERYPKTEVDEMLKTLRAEHEAAVNNLKEAHSVEIEAVKDAIGKASTEALRSASLEQLSTLVRDGLFDTIPEELAKLIKEEVELILTARANS